MCLKLEEYDREILDFDLYLLYNYYTYVLYIIYKLLKSFYILYIIQSILSKTTRQCQGKIRFGKRAARRTRNYCANKADFDPHQVG